MNELTKELLVSAGVGEVDATRIADTGLPEGEIGHLLVRLERGDPLVLAYDANVPLVVEAGRVFALDDTRRLVDSSVGAFLAVLARYRRYVEDVVQAATEEEGEQVAIRAAEEMRALDPSAFEEERFYWPIVCAQMIEGRL